MVVANNEINDDKTYMSNAGNFYHIPTVENLGGKSFEFPPEPR